MFWKYWWSCQSPILIKIWNHISGKPSKTKWNSIVQGGKMTYHRFGTQQKSLPMSAKAEFGQRKLPILSKWFKVQIQSQMPLASSLLVKTKTERKQEMFRFSWNFPHSIKTIQCLNQCRKTLESKCGAGDEQHMTSTSRLWTLKKNCLNKFLIIYARKGLLQNIKSKCW